MRKMLTSGAVLAAAMLWASLAQGGAWSDGQYLPDYGGHSRHGHRDWSGGYGGRGGHVHGPCWVWNQGQWVWVCQ
ncbi:hypothetical protein C5688_12270 [Methylocystis sp. MitZ-2018]|jgi:hypothetical protein|nr:hypothetical protein C5688_12270 [Methylocystis sp. MitZ-2018]